MRNPPAVWLVIEDLTKFGTAVRGVFETKLGALENVGGVLRNRKGLGEEWKHLGDVSGGAGVEFRWKHESGTLIVIQKPVLP